MFKQSIKKALCVVATGLFIATGASAQEKQSFKMAWSIYAGWMPWAYAVDHGIVDKWADKYGIDIEVVQFNDYIESINQFTVGEFDAGAMTNMDALTIPAAGGVDTTALILGDYSNGNDGILLKDATSMEDIRGRSVNLVELSVSHYFLARALEEHGMSERDIKVINTSDADAVASFTTPGVTAAAVWNPQLSMIKQQYPDAVQVFDSSQIPGEIIDMVAVHTEVLKANPDFGKALVGAWFETLEIMSGDGEEARKARTFMAERAGTDLASFDAQLAETMLFYTPADAHAFATDDALRNTMDRVRLFSFDKGLLGNGAPSADVIGMQFADGATLGSANNIKLRFDPSFVRMAMEDKL
ncbi:NitT/TauT family transport system substrate-binding protein [Halopseudomonas xinjiangensis]|uniref:NitT/TauT family transport system substrate-binding protein n=1 Tax=Halopseudomonas xinjiangensis TaxID=487184 RepID=A0A1H1SVF1_9GAMM|nr:putative urea ABC transporter substrate-binding protein [Halopseudomonas xinjiangensis]SDS51793.1 NitT/TauT family transport system substrate-binding protein [Halopseudomonas xinjiangensis]